MTSQKSINSSVFKNILVGAVFMTVSLGLFLFAFGSFFFESIPSREFTDTRSGSMLGVFLACLVAFLFGLGELIKAFKQILFNRNNQ